MERRDRSILQQKASGTYDRNRYIRFLYKADGSDNNMAALGRKFGITRQAIRRIVSEAD